MIKKEFPYFSILVSIIIVNMFFSTYFITVFLAGVVFSIFMDAIKKEYFYLFVFVIFTFCMIETVHGIKLFTLTLISLFIYYFVIPRVRHIFSSSIMAKFVYILSFYFCFYLVSFFIDRNTGEMYLLFVFNFLIDSLIVGMFL